VDTSDIERLAIEMEAWVARTRCPTHGTTATMREDEVDCNELRCLGLEQLRGLGFDVEP
jgi:hypothetical protein